MNLPFLKTCLAVILFLSATRSYAQKNQVDTVKIGTYVLALHDFELEDRSYCMDAWIWAIYDKNKSYDFEKELEIIDEKEYKFQHVSVETIGNKCWFAAKVKSKIYRNWNLSTFPFDRVVLKIVFEGSNYDTNSMVFEADTKNSKIDTLRMKKLRDWKLNKFSVSATNSLYNTSFGNPSLDQNSLYPAFNIFIEIERNNSVIILFKLITGLIVAFFISCSVFFIKPTDVDPRFGLSVGGLFASVGNKYIVESIVPATNSLTMIDILHNITFLYILLINIISVISLYYYEKDTPGHLIISKRIDIYSFFSLIISYLVLFSLVILYFEGITD